MLLVLLSSFVVNCVYTSYNNNNMITIKYYSLIDSHYDCCIHLLSLACNFDVGVCPLLLLLMLDNADNDSYLVFYSTTVAL